LSRTEQPLRPGTPVDHRYWSRPPTRCGGKSSYRKLTPRPIKISTKQQRRPAFGLSQKNTIPIIAVAAVEGDQRFESAFLQGRVKQTHWL